MKETSKTLMFHICFQEINYFYTFYIIIIIISWSTDYSTIVLGCFSNKVSNN